MEIPESFRNAQKAAFQDKTIAHHVAVSTTGALGGVTVAPAVTSSGSYSVNLQVVKDVLEAQEWGLTVNKDVRITSSDALPIPIGDYVKHGSETYRVIQRIDADSYWLLYGKRV